MSVFNLKILQVQDIEDFKALISIFKEVFEDHSPPASPTQLKQLLSDKNFFVITAAHNQKIIGGLTAYILNKYNKPKPEVFLYDIGVTPSFQRQGVGRLLLHHLKEYCKKMNFEMFFVQADGDDSDAIAFYKASKGKPSEVINFDFEL